MIINIELKRGLGMILKFKKGFSLVELLVVIAIIGILAAVGITAYSGYTKNAKQKASASQHASVVASLNAEYAKCAGGEGSFAWGETCATAVTGTLLMAHFAIDGGDQPLANPYETDTSSVDTDHDATPMAQVFTSGDTVDIDGRIAVVCDDTGVTGGCEIATDTGDGANTVTTVSRY